MNSSPKTRWAWLIGTFFGIGNLKPGSGTWASVVTLLLWFGATHVIPPAERLMASVALAVLITTIGIFASTVVARESGIKDPGFVVIDEVAGQMIAMIAVPAGWNYLILSLILFRGFDIFKPPPLRRLEQLPEGSGIMLDDVGAGIYALILTHAAVHLRVLG